ncbi:MAG: hypothetical protein AAFR42_12180 [Cyanobacteria bacterium J06628_6]
METADLTETNLAGAQVSGALFTDAKGLTPEQAHWLRDQGALNVPCV